MSNPNIYARYPVPLRLIHWSTAAIIITLLGVGFYMADLAPDASNKYDLYPTHMALGMIALALILLRLPMRIRGPIPGPVSGLKKWEYKLSRLVHTLLYLAMLGMPVSGYLMNSTYAYAEGLDMFGLFMIPDITDKSEYWTEVTHSIHSFIARSFEVLLICHLGGVIKHRFFDAKEHDVLKRMM